MSMAYFLHTRKLLQAFDYMPDRIVLLLCNFALWQAKLFVLPFFFHDSHLPKKSICRMLTKNSSSVAFLQILRKIASIFYAKIKGLNAPLSVKHCDRQGKTAYF